MKRMTAIVIVLALLLSGCGGEGEQRQIALIVKGTETEFWQSVYRGAQAAAVEFDVCLTLHGPKVERDGTEQLDTIKQVAATEPDCILLAATDYERMAQPVEDTIAAGIPVVMVDSDANSQKTVAFVGTDNRELGASLARTLQAQCPEGTIGIMSFVQGTYPAILREESFREAMGEKYHLLETQFCQSDVGEAYIKTLAMLKDCPELTAIAALNAQAGEGVAMALEQADRSDIRLYAIDCTPNLAMYMEDGFVSAALLQNPYQMGYYGVAAAVACLDGKETNDHYTDIYVVDKTMIFEPPYEQLIFPFEKPSQ